MSLDTARGPINIPKTSASSVVTDVPSGFDASRLKTIPTTNKYADSVPANWTVLPTTGDQIEARNSITGSVFSGTPKEFGRHLRGQN